MTGADLGLADSYINGDFSFDDEDNGLLNLLMVNIYLFTYCLYVCIGLVFFC